MESSTRCLSSGFRYLAFTEKKYWAERYSYRMSSGQGKVKVGFNKTQIKNGHIVTVRKDGTVKSILGVYPPIKVK